MTARRILLLVPHPDDEVVGCAAAISRARADGARLFALYLTTGVPAPETDWSWRQAAHSSRVELRRQEALAAAAALGIEPVAFYDWPSRQLKAHLEEAEARIRAVAAQHAVDCVWVPAYEGGHQDHDVANFLASTLARTLPVIEFSEYNAWPGARWQAFPSSIRAETILVLSPAEAATKASLLALYRSERRHLKHVGCQREALRPLAEYDYRRPPHPGPLFYQRFQWIRFRHPRVDFTSPAEVCDAFERFRAETGQKGWTVHG
jgi:LmbE family N-acetylglucosaminyl deacetylase